MKKSFIPLLALLLCFSMCACGGSSRIVGTWYLENDEDTVIVFTDEGKCYSKAEGRTYDYIAQDGQLILTDSWLGSTSMEYRILGNKLELSQGGETLTLKKR